MRNYGTLQMVESSPYSFDEPLSIEETKTLIKCQTATNDEDFLIQNYITAARDIAEILQNRDLVPKRWDLYLDGFSEYEIELRHPLRSVESIEYTDSENVVTELLDGTGFTKDLSRGLIMPLYGQSWPSFTPFPSSSVRVRFTSGYTSSSPFWQHGGARIKAGMGLLISMWYWHRIPFVPGASAIAELPYAATSLLSFGAKPRVR
jgi:uncharacterized phiE125 gp8 family phage protein